MSTDLLKERHENYEKYLPKMKTGKDVCKRYIDLGRQMGKTTLLLQTVHTGSTIVVTNSKMIDIFNRQLPDNIVCRFITYNGRDPQELSLLLRGLDKKMIFIDNAVMDNIALGAIEEIYS